MFLFRPVQPWGRDLLIEPAERKNHSWPLVIAAISIVILFVRARIFKLIGLGGLVAAGIMTIARLRVMIPDIHQFASWFSGNILLDGATLFFVSAAVFLWLVRLAVVVEYHWFYREGTGHRYENQGCWLPIRWNSTAIAFFLICIQIAAYLARLR